MGDVMERVKVLVVGAGGREHALAWRLASSPLAERVYVAPGSDGIAQTPGVVCAPVAATDAAGLVALARAEGIGLVVIGPEAPLVAGVSDALKAAGVPVFGPSRAAAQLEASKAFAKLIMDEAGVPTAAWRGFDSLDEARAYVRAQAHPLVIKADGLAAGKGVVISQSAEESDAVLESFMVGGQHGAAGQRVVIEECLRGPEVSFMVATDGRVVAPLSTSQDHKRLGDGDAGPNTGGMGAITPSPHASAALEAEVMARVIRPTLAALAARGIAYRGFLYAGLMLCADGVRVLEFNVRLGDPETQALMVALEADLLEFLLRAARGELVEGERLATERAAACVVLAARGYPEAPVKGARIAGLERVEGAQVFHAGTRLCAAGFEVAGGRVLGVTAAGADVASAVEAAYAGAALIGFEGMQRRADIGRVR
jgi:phosphoribosylamine---glycine ligase